VNFCLSKGLGAPVGSLLVGPKEKIAPGRMYRKRLGGGMRQAGVLAAAGLIALEEMPNRLDEDHSNARYLATELAGIDGISIDPSRVATNIVIFDVAGAGIVPSELSAKLKERGVLINGIGGTLLRAVTHYDADRAACERAAAAVREILN
jgi:threonine aldolase